MTAVLREEGKKRGHWLNIEQALGIFSCLQTTVLLLRDTKWDEGISEELGQAKVLWKEEEKKKMLLSWRKDEVIPRGRRFKLLEGSKIENSLLEYNSTESAQNLNVFRSSWYLQ